MRHFQSDSKIGERLVADLMTLNPLTVHKDKLAAEALNLLERHRIDDLVVIDESNVAAPAARQRIVAARHSAFGCAQGRPYQHQMALGNLTA